MTAPTPTKDQLDAWATSADGPVALTVQQRLVPVEGREAVFFPPTFAIKSEVPYNIDTLADGRKVALVDSVGSQANRMEPLFLEPRFRHLVPQITVTYGDEKKETDGVVSLLEAGHRLGDALVRSTALHERARAAFKALNRGDATRLAKLAPTSLVFGAWDSRDTMVKIPRMLGSVIRAWDVSALTRSAQFNPAVDYSTLEIISEAEREKAESKGSGALAERGFVHVPSTGDHGGIVAAGPIRRDVTLNLIQLRRLNGEDPALLRCYLLGLALVAAVEPLDPFLRQGCILVPDVEAPAVWQLVHRSGEREDINLSRELVASYATQAAEAFGVGDSEELAFDKSLAKKDAKTKK